MDGRIGRRGLLALAGMPALAALPFIGSARAQLANESAFDRIMRTRKIRVAGLTGELPFFNKDNASGTWSGACVEMMDDIAKQLGGVSVDYVDSTYGNSVLQLQAGQVDIAFALSATPQRALAIDFTRAVFHHGFGICARPDFKARTWSDVDRPEIRIVVEVGSTPEVVARRFAPRAEVAALKTRDEVVLALASGRAQCAVFAALVGLTAMRKNPAIGPFTMLSGPVVSIPSNIGIRREPDRRWRDFLDVWIDFNRGTGQIRDWLLGGLAPVGLAVADVPPEVTF